jgi:hypothetical protein
MGADHQEGRSLCRLGFLLLEENALTSHIRNPKDFWTAIIYITVGSIFLIISRDYPMGSTFKMGPAYFPTVLSSLLIIIGVISLTRSFIQQGTPIGSFTFRGLLLVITATMLFGLIVRGAGLIIALPALAAGLTLFCILVFLKGLGVPLPIVGLWFTR